MRRVLAALVLAGCAHEPLMQGNVVAPEKAEMITPGMTRAQVREILGDPVYADRLHPDRFVYVEMREEEGRLMRRQVVVRFDRAGRVLRVERQP